MYVVINRANLSNGIYISIQTKLLKAVYLLSDYGLLID